MWGAWFFCYFLLLLLLQYLCLARGFSRYLLSAAALDLPASLLPLL